jgi:nitrogenase iron protein NifH
MWFRIEYSPDCNQADEYRALAKKIINNTDLRIPTPISMDELEQLLIEFGVLDDDQKIAHLIGKTEKELAPV